MMRRRPALRLALLMLSVASIPAAAQSAARPNETPGAQQPAAPGRVQRFVERFNAANTTHDGRLTPEQAQAANMRYLVQHFDEIDTQHHGYVTLADVRAYRERMHAARGQTQD